MTNASNDYLHLCCQEFLFLNNFIKANVCTASRQPNTTIWAPVGSSADHRFKYQRTRQLLAPAAGTIPVGVRVLNLCDSTQFFQEVSCNSLTIPDLMYLNIKIPRSGQTKRAKRLRAHTLRFTYFSCCVAFCS